MEQSPFWEADGHSASEEITYLLWNPKVHYSAHKSLVSILSQMHLLHTGFTFIKQIWLITK
jgi:hypothetical protein